MRKVINHLCIVVCVVALLTGCTQISAYQGKKIYFFDTAKGELVEETLPREFNALTDNQEMVKYIIARLKDNKTVQLSTLQSGTVMPIETAAIKDNIVVIKFNKSYDALSPKEKIGMRVALVYSLTELEFIDAVEFYIEESPLTTAMGKIVGPIYANSINKEILDPNPATNSYTLSVYFANKQGKLVEEEHNISVSNATLLEKPLVEELIKGPNSDKLYPTVPPDMKIKDASTVNGVCQIDLSFDTKSKFFKNNEQKELMIYSIVNSLTSLPQIKKVAIFIDGKNDVAFTPDIDFTDTFERSEEYISME